MATSRYANPGTRLFDSAGNLLSNGKIYFYSPGTTTEKAIYTTSALSTERANPVILSGSGLIPEIWMDGEYDVVVQNSSSVQVDTGDDVNPSAAALNLSDWSSTQNYPLNAVVKGSDGNVYISAVANNLNNDPITTLGTSWNYFFARSAKRGLTAGTTQTQGGATAMTASINEFSTVANTNDGGALPDDTAIGEQVMVVNNGANALKVWPASGDSINDGATDAADTETIAAGAYRIYTRQTATKWSYSEGGGFEEIFTSSGTFTKPAGYKWFVVEAWGGGAGGAGADTDGNENAGGGGGGAYVRAIFSADDIGATEIVTIGAGGTAGLTQASPTAGGTGGNTTFGSLLTAYGGAPGGVDNAITNGGGGGGGGVLSAGSAGSTGSGGNGGTPNLSTGTNGADNHFGGGNGGFNSAGGDSVDGGGGGGSNTGIGGSSINGGGGGGGGNNSSGRSTSVLGGNGGAGRGSNMDGEAPGGGGAGGRADNIQPGAGARGELRVRGV